MAVDINNTMVVAMNTWGDEKSQKTKNNVFKQPLLLHIASILNAESICKHFYHYFLSNFWRTFQTLCG